MTQGYEANHSGQFLENMVERAFAARGFIVRDYGIDANNLDLFSPRILVRRVPYRSVAGLQCHSEFVATFESRRCRIECKWQDGPGSADERLFYALVNAQEAYPENESLLLLGGNGARQKLVDYIKRKAAETSHKKIWVLNVNEFPRWLKNEFVLSTESAA